MSSLTTPILRIAAEGWVFLCLLLALAALAFLGGHWVLLALLVAALVFTGTYFRDAPRHTVAKPTGVLAPVDGTVSFRRECHDPWLGREAIRIRIQLPLFGNYFLRAPVEGEVTAVEAAPKRVSCLRTDEGESILLVAGPWALLGASPVWPAFGDRVGQGRLCGVRRLVRELDVYLPADCRVEVQLGQQIRCGETVLATLLRRNT